MGTTLATKQDLEILKRDFENRFALLEQRFDATFARLDQKIDAVYARLDRKIDTTFAQLDLRMTVKLGSMLFVGFGLTIAAIRLWL